MDRWLPFIATLLAGSLVALQAPINGMLGRTIGSLAAASVSFATGLAVLVAITVVAGGGFGQLGEVGNLNWYYLIGGVLGAVYVTTVLITVNHLGAGSVAAATIAGQLTMSVLIDRAGVLGLPERGLTTQRLLGIALLSVGAYLVVRD